MELRLLCSAKNSVSEYIGQDLDGMAYSGGDNWK
jgi:hypothetical protein